MSRSRAVDIAAALIAIALLSVLVSMRASLERANTTVPSTYDTGARGYAAVYALLGRERAPVERFEDPVSHVSDRRGVFVIAGDYQMLAVAPSAKQRHLLDGWVRGGGKLELFGLVPFWMRGDFGLPQQARMSAQVARAGCGLAVPSWRVAGLFTGGLDGACRRDRVTLLAAAGRAVVIAYRRGKGLVLYSPTATILDNEHLAQLDNARFAYAIFGDGPVLFEEHGYGHVRARSFWQVLPVPMRVAVVVAVAALLLAVAGANLPFATPQPAGDTDKRDSGEYIDSLARMLQRGVAQRALIQRFCAAIETALTPRAQSDDRARDLLDRAHALQSLSGPRAEDVLAASRLFSQVQKEYRW